MKGFVFSGLSVLLEDEIIILSLDPPLFATVFPTTGSLSLCLSGQRGAEHDLPSSHVLLLGNLLALGCSHCHVPSSSSHLQLLLLPVLCRADVVPSSLMGEMQVRRSSRGVKSVLR